MGIFLILTSVAGCLSNPPVPDSSAEVQEVITYQTTVIPQTPDQTTITPGTVMATVTPHFTGTISGGSNKLTIGSNQSPPISEDRAWKYAEQHLAKFQMQNFRQSEVISLGQGKFTFENGTQTWKWRFHVNRCSEAGDCYNLADVDIDANDGDLIDLVFLD